MAKIRLDTTDIFRRTLREVCAEARQKVWNTDENWVFKLNGKDYKFNKERKTNRENQSELPRQQEPQQRETQQTHQIAYHSDQLFQQPQHCVPLHQASFMPYKMLGDRTYYNM
jgi:hypothetical protein